MKLTNLIEMIKQGDMSADGLRYLINCKTECEYLDYKLLISLESDNELCEISRDIVALKNIGGGYIVVGVKDKSWEPVGLSSSLPYDTKLLRDKIRKATGLDLDIDIVHHKLIIKNIAKVFSLIFVRSSRKRSKLRIPSIVKKDFNTKYKHALRKGDIYIRNGDETKKLTEQEELENILDNLIEKEASIQLGKPTSSPFAVNNGLYKLLEKGFIKFIGREDYRDNLLKAIEKDPRIWIINVHGPGGVGKSALVNWVVYNYYENRNFESILQLTAKETILTDQGIKSYNRSLYSLEELVDQILILFEESIEQDNEIKRALALDYISAWKMLIVLDNMETVNDGRIIQFIQDFPVDSKSKVVITSRNKTDGWELSFPIREFSISETNEFIKTKSEEMQLQFPMDEKIIEQVHHASGGLPLATQWILGNYKTNRDISEIIKKSKDRNSPILEFTFRNIWTLLSDNAKKTLAVFPIFDNPPSVKEISIALYKDIEIVDDSLAELLNCTLVNRIIKTDGNQVYVALPITLNFARNRLNDMKNFEIQCQQRFQRYNSQILLHDSEISRFKSFFDMYKIKNENIKKAVIFIRRAESEEYFGNPHSAEQFIKDAISLSPNSPIINALIAQYESNCHRLSTAIEYINKSEKFVNKSNGKLIYTIKAKIYDLCRNNEVRLSSLKKAFEYDKKDSILKHQIGVAYSKIGSTDEAIKIFSEIIKQEIQKEPPTETIVYSLKTRIINYKRLDLIDKADQDIEYLKELSEKYPNLSYSIGDTDEL